MLTLPAASGRAPLLVLAVGNPGRGDDALGPLAADRLEALRLPGVEVRSDYQLQIEHALDLIGRSEVIFVDASAAGPAPFAQTMLAAAHDRSHSTHALSPAAVLDVFRRLSDATPPQASQLAIRGYAFELGAPLSEAAAVNLDAALQWLAAHAVKAVKQRRQSASPGCP